MEKKYCVEILKDLDTDPQKSQQHNHFQYKTKQGCTGSHTTTTTGSFS